MGDPAPVSKTPTLGNATVKQLTTAKALDRELYGTSVAEALRARAVRGHVRHPAYCTSRTCGPVVDVVSSVRRSHAGSGVQFIHVEIYEGNDPANGENRSRSGSFPFEPWVFLVGEDGRIKDRFEGTVSVRELDAAVDEHLVG